MISRNAPAHVHTGPPCPECGAATGKPCSPAESRYAPFCCPACYADHRSPEGA